MRLRPTLSAPLTASIKAHFARVTAPARWFVRGSLAWLVFKPGSRPRRLTHRWSVATARYFLARPRIAVPMKRVLQRFPALERRFRVMLLSPVETTYYDTSIDGPADLSLTARGVYAELKAAIAKRNASR